MLALILAVLFLFAGEVYDVGGDVKAPQVIHRVPPHFTDKSRETHVSGTVLVSLIVTEVGDPDSVKVIKGIEKDLDDSAVEAVKQWKFKPGTKQGKAVAVRLSIEIDFKAL